MDTIIISIIQMKKQAQRDKPRDTVSVGASDSRAYWY